MGDPPGGRSIKHISEEAKKGLTRPPESIPVCYTLHFSWVLLTPKKTDSSPKTRKAGGVARWTHHHHHHHPPKSSTCTMPLSCGPRSSPSFPLSLRKQQGNGRDYRVPALTHLQPAPKSKGASAGRNPNPFGQSLCRRSAADVARLLLSLAQSAIWR